MINFRMYPGGVGSMIEGWTKNMAVGASLADIRLILLLIIWCTGISNAALALGSLEVAVWMIPFGLAVNLPCLITRRYNRPRLQKVTKKS